MLLDVRRANIVNNLCGKMLLMLFWFVCKVVEMEEGCFSKFNWELKRLNGFFSVVVSAANSGK